MHLEYLISGNSARSHLPDKNKQQNWALPTSDYQKFESH